eukprot:COSAG02_NODE_3477_length_6673_cov_40.773922_1_plen_126_part_00
MGDKLDGRLEFGMVVEGSQKSPPILGEILIAHVEGGSATHYSSVTSSSSGVKPVEEGRDEEPVKLPSGSVNAQSPNMDAVLTQRPPGGLRLQPRHNYTPHLTKRERPGVRVGFHSVQYNPALAST